MELNALRIRIKNAAATGMLGIMMVVPFTALARLVQERGERGPPALSAAGRSALALKEINHLAPVGRAYQSNSASLQHIVFPPASPKFGAILAGALLLVPLGLSTLGLSCRDRKGILVRCFALPYMSKIKSREIRQTIGL